MKITAKGVMLFGLNSLLKEWERMKNDWDKLTFTRMGNGEDYRLLCLNITKLQRLINELEAQNEEDGR